MPGFSSGSLPGFSGVTGTFWILPGNGVWHGLVLVAITWTHSQGSLRVASPLHLIWSCLCPEKWQNWGFFSCLDAPLASKQQSGTEGGIYCAMVDTKSFGGYAWKQWSRQPSVLTKSIWMSEQVLAAVWFSTWALLNCNSFHGAPLTLPFLFAHGPCLHGLLGSLGWQTVPQSRLWCFAGLFPPAFISEGHNFSLVTCPEKCSSLSRSDFSWWLTCKANAAKTLPILPCSQSGVHSSLSIL